LLARSNLRALAAVHWGQTSSATTPTIASTMTAIWGDVLI
jgi:hypothetical protein